MGGRAYGNPCYGGAIAGARGASTRSLTVELTSRGIYVSARRTRRVLGGKSTTTLWAVAEERGMRQERDKQGKEASLESLCSPGGEGKRKSFFLTEGETVHNTMVFEQVRKQMGTRVHRPDTVPGSNPASRSSLHTPVARSSVRPGTQSPIRRPRPRPRPARRRGRRHRHRETSLSSRIGRPSPSSRAPPPVRVPASSEAYRRATTMTGTGVGRNGPWR